MNLFDELEAEQAERDADRFRRARLHESAHAVLSWCLSTRDRTKASATVLPDGRGEHITLPAEYPITDGPAFEARMRAEAVEARAGEASAIVFGLADPARGCEDDREAARRRVGSEAASAAALQEAIAMVREYREPIERFAAAIAANHDRLDGHRYVEAMSEALGDRDPREAEINARRRFEELIAGGTPQDQAWRIARGEAATSRTAAGRVIREGPHWRETVYPGGRILEVGVRPRGGARGPQR